MGIEMKDQKDTSVKSFKSEIHKGLYGIINDSPLHINDITRITNIDIKQLYEVLFEMQIKNEILCLSGNYYVKVNHKI
jgi:DNA processing protein